MPSASATSFGLTGAPKSLTNPSTATIASPNPCASWIVWATFAASASESPANVHGPPVEVTAYSFSGTSRPVIFNRPSESSRLRFSIMIVSKAPAIPFVPETICTKSSAVALRSWWSTSRAIPGHSSAMAFRSVAKW